MSLDLEDLEGYKTARHVASMAALVLLCALAILGFAPNCTGCVDQAKSPDYWRCEWGDTWMQTCGKDKECKKVTLYRCVNGRWVEEK